MLTNQSHIDSKDQYLWRQERDNISNRLKKISIDTSSAFVSNFKRIDLIKQDRILAMCLFDLMPSIDQCKDIDKICQESGKQIWLVTDNIIDPNFHNFKNISVHNVFSIINKNLFVVVVG
jgi:hypothetical protein